MTPVRATFKGAVKRTPNGSPGTCSTCGVESVELVPEDEESADGDRWDMAGYERDCLRPHASISGPRGKTSVHLEAHVKHS